MDGKENNKACWSLTQDLINPMDINSDNKLKYKTTIELVDKTGKIIVIEFVECKITYLGDKKWGWKVV